MIESENNISNKLNMLKKVSIITIGDREYIGGQIKNLYDCRACLYSFQANKIEYLDEYTKSQTNYDTYEQYYNYLDSKYNLNDYNNYNKTAQKLIDSVSE